MRRVPAAVVSSVIAVTAATAVACGGGGGGARTGRQAARQDVPEPAVAPPAASSLPGRVVRLAGEPEGLALDARTDTLAVAVRRPDGVVLVDPSSGAERRGVALAGAARHLELAGPGGPVLVPSEGNDRLYRLSLPGGTVVGDDAVGRQPHDAAPAAGGRVFVGDELADTVHVLAPGAPAQVVGAPTQPGGLASAEDGSVVVVVGVRGRRIQAYTPDGRVLDSAPCGVGPTHVRAGLGDYFYVADTQGAAVLVFRASTDAGGVRQVGRVPTGGGAPYGLAVDRSRGRVYVTLTGTNRLLSFRVDGDGLAADRSWDTVRQPDDVVVDEGSGRVVVAGSTADGALQLIDP